MAVEMDAATMAKMLQAIQRQGEALANLTQRLTIQRPSTSTNTSTAVVSHYITFKKFEPEEGDFASYK